MHDLDSQVKDLIGEITRFHDHCAHWYEFHQSRRTLLLTANWLFTLLATISGISGFKKEFQGFAGPLAAGFSALSAAAIKEMSTFRFAEKTDYYGSAITLCDEFCLTLRHQVATESQLNDVVGDYKALRRQERNALPNKKSKEQDPDTGR
jgi:hypothetical protein